MTKLKKSQAILALSAFLTNVAVSQTVPSEISVALLSLSDEQFQLYGAILSPPQPQIPHLGPNARWKEPVRNEAIRYLKSAYAPTATSYLGGFRIPTIEVITWTTSAKPWSLFYYDLEGSSAVLYTDQTATSIATDEQAKALILNRMRLLLKLRLPSSPLQSFSLDRMTLPSGKPLVYGNMTYGVTHTSAGKLPSGETRKWDHTFSFWTDGTHVFLNWTQVSDTQVIPTSGRAQPSTERTVRLIPG